MAVAKVIVGLALLGSTAASNYHELQPKEVSVVDLSTLKVRGITTTTVPPTTTTSSPPRRGPFYAPGRPSTTRPIHALPASQAKAFIYQHESGNNPCAYYPSKSDCNYTGQAACGLGGAKPCSKMRDYCAMSDYACQDRWFTGYAISRYGSWEGAYAFWIRHRWW